MRRLLPARDRRPGVLALIDLVQDIDVMLPVLESLRARGEARLKVVVSRWLLKESPRTAALLASRGFAFSAVPRRRIITGDAPGLRGVDAVIAASESSHPAHAAAHALALRAKGLGLRTYALQHGFENVGLFGLEAGSADFASEVVFCWYPPQAAPPDLSATTRAKLDHAGRPAAAPPAEAANEAAYDVGVFENLHWDRYGEEDRQRFAAGLAAAARALPGKRFLFRPHPAGGWGDRLGHELAKLPNVIPVRAESARAQARSGAELVLGMGRVITTPSTIALDAAAAGAPVALASSGGAAYHPLPVLQTTDDWIAFASGSGFDRRTLDQFVSRVLVAGDGAPRIAGRLSRDLMGLTRQRHG